MNPEKISKKIKEIRLKSGITQKEFADKYNVTYQAVSKWENAKNLPDVSILREICKDFNLDINDLMDNPISKKSNIKSYIIVGSIVTLIIIVAVILLINKNDNFQFKTLSSNCPNFTVSGNISYNDRKSAIYISDVTYCGGDDEVEYEKIECELYEKKNSMSYLVSSYTYDENKIKLEEFLKKVRFVIENYNSICRRYEENSLFLSIKATVDNKVIEYEIPLALNSEC